MCCESCPQYENCLINDKIKDDCCNKCPDYNTCFSINEEEESDEWEN